jgi:hypothetical protein
MKYFSILLIVCLGMRTHVSLAQKDEEVLLEGIDSTGLPGDQFSLEGALELFKNSTSPEDLEKQLNASSNNVNNLDLDGDNETDYIRVIDKMEGTSHAIVLQVAINEKESQDVAVIETEKTGDGTAIVQILGDEELYGETKIVEPIEEMAVPANEHGKGGPWSPAIEFKKVIVNVWLWVGVRAIYAPLYTPWVSPWYWHHYPMWWKPWRPVGFGIHYAHCNMYRMHHHPVVVHRVVVAHKIYAPHRVASAVVRNRYAGAHQRHKANHQPGPGRGPGPKGHGPGPRGNGPGPKGKGGGRGHR